MTPNFPSGCALRLNKKGTLTVNDLLQTSLPLDNSTALAMAMLEMAYVASLIVGGGLMLLSTMFGQDADADIDFGDVDVDIDIDADVDTDFTPGTAQDPSAMSLASWFSTQFVVYFLAAFGLVGVVLTYMTTQSKTVVAVAATVAGILIGQSAHHVMRYLKRSSSDSAATTADFFNQPARVTVKVEPTQRGEIAVMIRGRERFVPANPKHNDQTFNVGETVAIISYHAGTAEIVSKEEFEFVSDKPLGDSQ